MVDQNTVEGESEPFCTLSAVLYDAGTLEAGWSIGIAMLWETSGCRCHQSVSDGPELDTSKNPTRNPGIHRTDQGVDIINDDYLFMIVIMF